MAKLPTSFNIGDRDEMTVVKLLDIVERMYTDIAEAVNKKPDLYERNVDGQTSDIYLSNGSININSSTNKVEMLTQHVDSTSVLWTEIT